jgi:arylsulfatase A-like enzyme
LDNLAIQDDFVKYGTAGSRLGHRLQSVDMKVLVIVADGLGCAYLGCYGNEWIETPNLDRLATQSVVFDQHFADYPDSAGARRAWHTGSYQFPHPNAIERAPASKSGDLIHLLTKRGVYTSLVHSAQPTHDFARGWRRVFASTPSAGDSMTCLERVLERAGDALDTLAAHEPWLLWLDLPALSPPWEMPKEYRNLYFLDDGSEADDSPGDEENPGDVVEEAPLIPWSGPLPDRVDPQDLATFLRLQKSFAAMVSFVDASLGRLLDDLEERELMDEVVILFTSGHGMALGEHGAAVEAVPWLHEEKTHVPLFIRLPAEAEGGRRVASLTQSVDVGPTLLALFNVAARVHGFNLLPLCRGEVESVRTYACSGFRTGESIEWSLRAPHWALLLPVFQDVEDTPRPPQLYVKPDDRWEVNNLYQHHPEVAKHLEETLRGFVQAAGSPGPFDAPQLRDTDKQYHEAPTANEDTQTTGDR